jgi:hypothetical protein
VRQLRPGSCRHPPWMAAGRHVGRGIRAALLRHARAAGTSAMQQPAGATHPVPTPPELVGASPGREPLIPSRRTLSAAEQLMRSHRLLGAAHGLPGPTIAPPPPTHTHLTG